MMPGPKGEPPNGDRILTVDASGRIHRVAMRIGYTLQDSHRDDGYCVSDGEGIHTVGPL